MWVKPSTQAEAVLAGRLSHSEAPESVQSMLRLSYYNLAIAIVKEDNKDKRQKMLADVPETCQSQVKDEVIRLWPRRDSYGK